MDPVTQGVLGAALAVVAAPKDKIGQAAVVGSLAGMAPDLDILIRSSEDHLLHLDFHRQFTHSLYFVPIGALLVAAFLWPLYRRGSSTFGHIYRFAFLGYVSHAPLDACTTYGTRLLWPFDTTRFAWNNVAVIDPLFTFPLILFLIVAAWKKRPAIMGAGMIYGLLYLSFGLLQNYRAEAVVAELAAKRGHQPLRLEAKPTLGNLVLFRGIYEHGDRYYVDGVRISVFGEVRLYEGGSLAKFEQAKAYPKLTATTRAGMDIQRFRTFSDNFLAQHPDKPNRVGDVRYSLLPDSVRPLWGIVLDNEKPNAHIGFENWREMDDTALARFKAMIMGRDDPAQ